MSSWFEKIILPPDSAETFPLAPLPASESIFQLLLLRVGVIFEPVVPFTGGFSFLSVPPPPLSDATSAETSAGESPNRKRSGPILKLVTFRLRLRVVPLVGFVQRVVRPGRAILRLQGKLDLQLRKRERRRPAYLAHGCVRVIREQQERALAPQVLVRKGGCIAESK